MRLPKGTLKVVTVDHKALRENAERTRNRGVIMVPPFKVYEWDEGAELLVVHDAQSFSARHLTTRVCYGKFPYAWAPRALYEQNAWFETDGEVSIDEQQTTKGT
jgi:hypothetical protein